MENLTSTFQHDNLTDKIEEAIAAEFSDSQITDVQPSEEEFPGLNKIIAGYQSWSWIFGKSPKFDIIVGDEKFTISNGMLSLVDEIPFDCNLLEHLYKSDCPNHQTLASIIENIV